MKLFSALLIATLVFLASCSGTDSTRQTVDQTAKDINGEFVAVRQAEQTLLTDLSEVYGRRESLDLSVQGMDASQGGLYETFPGSKYYYKTRPQGSALYFSPGRPVTDADRREVRLLEYLDPPLQKAARSSDLLTVAFYGVSGPGTMALLAPWADVVSSLPPGINISQFEWYTRGLHSGGVPVWSAQPFTDLVSGWVMDVSAGLPASGSDQGVVVLSVNLVRLANKHLGTSKGALALLGADGTLVGMTPGAEALLGVRALEAVDYLKQRKENTFAPAKYRLADPSQPADLQVLARGLASGAPQFEVSLGGKAVTVVQAPVTESKMLVAGFVPH